MENVSGDGIQRTARFQSKSQFRIPVYPYRPVQWENQNCQLTIPLQVNGKDWGMKAETDQAP